SVYNFGGKKKYDPRPYIDPGLRKLTENSYATIYTKTASRFSPLYTNPELTQIRSGSWIDNYEECRIVGVGWNSSNAPYAKIKFPLSNGNLADAYVDLLNAFVPETEYSDGRVGTLVLGMKTATAESAALARRIDGDRDSKYTVAVGSTIYRIAQTAGWSQILYSKGNIWQIAWLTDSEYNNIVTPIINFSIRTSQYLTDGYVNKAYNQNLGTSPSLSGVTWSQLSGTLPPGLNLASNGRISGTPTKAGTYTFAIKATYGGVSKSRAFRIYVTNSDEHKDTSINFTYDFKNFYANEFYQDYITIQDNSSNTNRSIRNYSFRVVGATLSSTSLPSGLEILEQSYRNGKSVAQVFLRGYPTTSRWYTFTLRAKRISDGGYNDKTFRIYIRPSRTVTPRRDTKMYINYIFATGTLGQSYYDWVSVGNGTSPITATRVSGELPQA
ncbi:MAG: putative Ig domain-containing protein, partial [Synergistaceae bacterium]|nr:putative Ig domain-containing protein [Synergistaceae bacterium]